MRHFKIKISPDSDQLKIFLINEETSSSISGYFSLRDGVRSSLNSLSSVISTAIICRSPGRSRFRISPRRSAVIKFTS